MGGVRVGAGGGCWTSSLNTRSPYVPHYGSPITMTCPRLVHVSWPRPQYFSIFFPLSCLYRLPSFFFCTAASDWPEASLLCSLVTPELQLVSKPLLDQTTRTQSSPAVSFPSALVPHSSPSLACVQQLFCCSVFVCFFTPQNNLIHLSELSGSNETSKNLMRAGKTMSSKQPSHNHHHTQFSCFPTFFPFFHCFFMCL